MRQHASVLHQVIAQGLADPHWLERAAHASGATCSRRRWRRIAGPATELDALGKRTLAVFDAIMQGRHRYGPDAIGYFIVSGAHRRR